MISYENCCRQKLLLSRNIIYRSSGDKLKEVVVLLSRVEKRDKTLGDNDDNS
jgi:hypothetical protein